MTTEANRKSHPFAMFTAWMLVVFLVLFPKGGIKPNNVPLTWGYMYIGLSLPLFLVLRLLFLPLRMPIQAIAALGLLAPFQIIFLYGALGVGVSEPGSVLSLFTSFFVMPLAFIFVYSAFFPWIDGVRVSRYFRLCILFAAIWGIFLFFWRPFTGHFIEVPYLTVNAGDYGELERTKHIARGFFSKLISTYNNGNIYGIATLILLPLYQTLEPVRWRRAIVIVALLFTLARTVWVGLMLVEAIPLGILLLSQIETFPVLYLGQALRKVVTVTLTLGLVFVALLFTATANISFLLDPTAGGRSNELATFIGPLTFWPSIPLGGFFEVAYAAAALFLGWSGFLTFTLLMVSPLLVLLVDSSALVSPVRRSALKGLMIYALLAWSDGAIELIPVMAFYWFTYMIFLFGWPNEKQTLALLPQARKLRNPFRNVPKLPQAAASV